MKKSDITEQDVKKFHAAHQYFFNDRTFEEAIQDAQLVESKGAASVDARKIVEKSINESKKKSVRKPKRKSKSPLFETHVLCGNCGSPELELSKKKTMIRCKKCDSRDLVENIDSIKRFVK